MRRPADLDLLRNPDGLRRRSRRRRRAAGRQQQQQQKGEGVPGVARDARPSLERCRAPRAGTGRIRHLTPSCRVHREDSLMAGVTQSQSAVYGDQPS
jgi:hypothetical protein